MREEEYLDLNKMKIIHLSQLNNVMTNDTLEHKSYENKMNKMNKNFIKQNAMSDWCQSVSVKVLNFNEK